MNPPFPLTDLFGERLTLVQQPEPIGGGFSGAVVFKAHCRGGTFAVRGWPRGVNSARLRGLHRLLRHVADRGVPVAVPLTTVRGDTLFAREHRWWQVEPWLPGHADFRDSPTDAKLAAAMETLAAFHHAASSFVATAGEAEWFEGPAIGPAPAVGDRLAIVERLRSSEAATITLAVATGTGEFADLSRSVLACFDRFAAEIEAELRFFSAIDVPLLPCLRDVWSAHVLFSGDEVTGLIDAAACRRDTVATDLSRLIGSLIGDDAFRWTAAIAEYVRRRPLTDGEAALVPILDRSGVLLSAIAWLRRRYVEGQSCETPPVIARLREAVARIERL